MIYLLTLLSFSLCWAKFDLSLGAQGRSLPNIGAETYAESGYGQILWGKKEGPQDVLYGLIRPSLAINSSGVINGIRGELEIFPISFLGLAVGRQYQHSNFEFPFFDCDQVTCKGEYIRNYVETKMVLGHKGWVVLGNYKIDTIRSPSRDAPMADWRHVIIGEPGEEVQHDKKMIVAKMFSNKLAGVLIENVQFMGSRERKESFAAVYQVRHNDTSYMLGAGTFRTSQEPMGLIFYIRVHHLVLPSLKLF
jgi:hypothetical protein